MSNLLVFMTLEFGTFTIKTNEAQDLVLKGSWFIREEYTDFSSQKFSVNLRFCVGLHS